MFLKRKSYDTDNPYSDEYLNPDLKGYLRRATCPTCGLFTELCKCADRARRPCSTCGKPNDNINPRNPLCESCDTIQDLNDD